MRSCLSLLVLALFLNAQNIARGQDDPAANGDKSPPETSKPEQPSAIKQLKDSEEKLAKQANDEISKIAKTIDDDPRAKTATAGILQPIYAVAESLSFPAFHWLAFALMSAGVVSFALQLVLGKLIALTRMGFSVQEIISDAISLAISVVGLVLTTQAAAENSKFTQSPAAVISATVVGVLLGIILYRWGQAQELEAVAGRTKPTPAKK